MYYGFLGMIVLTIIASTIRIVPQSRAYVVERIGAYNRTCNVGLHILIPFFDRVANKVSLKEQVVDFAPQPVITKDNVTMQIDTVVYYQITDPKLLLMVWIDQSTQSNLTATTLRNIVGDLELDETLTSRDIINSRMRSTLMNTDREESKYIVLKLKHYSTSIFRSNGKTSKAERKGVKQSYKQKEKDCCYLKC
ncbi:MAG: SPFH domain-containing protein [Thomasclavelia ramosa]